MKAYKLEADWRNDMDEKIIVAESIGEVMLEDGQEVVELCEVLSACACDGDVWEKGEDYPTAPDYIQENGNTYDMYGMAQVGSFGELDIARTDENKEEDECDFEGWDFNLWVGTYWNGSNHKLVAIEK